MDLAWLCMDCGNSVTKETYLFAQTKWVKYSEVPKLPQPQCPKCKSKVVIKFD